MIIQVGRELYSNHLLKSGSSVGLHQLSQSFIQTRFLLIYNEKRVACKSFWIVRTRVSMSFRERLFWERERRSDSTCKEHFHKDFWPWRHPEEAGRDSERRAACRAWQRWRWTYQKHLWAVKGRFIPRHKWLPLGTWGIRVARGKVLTFIVKWVWLALLLYVADDCSGR